MSKKTVFVCDVCGDQYDSKLELTSVEVPIAIGTEFRVLARMISAGECFSERDVCNKCRDGVYAQVVALCNTLGIETPAKGK